MLNKMMRTLLCGSMLLCLSAAALAQEAGMRCEDRGWRGDGYSRCAIRETTIPATRLLSVDGRRNGGVSVKGWERSDVLVRAKVESYGRTEAEAAAQLDQIRVETNGGSIRADGPSNGERQGWSVSFEVFVPHRTDLSLKAHNGGISISEVQGQIEFEAHNGGVALRRLGGAVHGQTHNGGLSIELDGERWNGEGLDVKTTNGGVNLIVPTNYSARLETRTVHGGMKIDFPVTVQGEIGREVSFDLGAGGARIRAVTTNGGVSVRRKG